MSVILPNKLAFGWSGIGNTYSVTRWAAFNQITDCLNVKIDDNGQIVVGGSSSSAMLDITQRLASVIGIELNGVTDRSACLLQINEGSGTSTEDIIQINSSGGSNGDIFKLDEYGFVGISESTPSAMLDIIQSSDVTGIEINGIANRSGVLLQIKEGTGTPTGNMFEINSSGGSGGNLVVINKSGSIGMNVSSPSAMLDIVQLNRIGLEINAQSGSFDPLVSIKNGATINAFTMVISSSGGSLGDMLTFDANGKLSLGNVGFSTNGVKGGGILDITPTSYTNGKDYITVSTTSFFEPARNVFCIRSTGYLGLGEPSPETFVELTNVSPYVTLHNSTHEDSDSGRESEIRAKGEQSGGEETTLGKIVFAHDGIADDQKGLIQISRNSGIDGDNPTLTIEIDSAGNTKIGDGGITNYTNIAADGTITLHGTAIKWCNVNLKPANIGLPSSNPPLRDEYQGFQFDRFDRTTEEQVYYIWHIPDCYHEGAASVRGHFGGFVENPPSGSGDENVVMGFEYKYIHPDDGDIFDFSSGTSNGIVNIPIIDGESAYKWHVSETGYCNTIGWEREGIVMFRFFRDATNANDTYDNEAVAANNDMWIGIYHLEFLKDRIGL